MAVTKVWQWQRGRGSVSDRASGHRWARDVQEEGATPGAPSQHPGHQSLAVSPPQRLFPRPPPPGQVALGPSHCLPLACLDCARPLCSSSSLPLLARCPLPVAYRWAWAHGPLPSPTSSTTTTPYTFTTAPPRTPSASSAPPSPSPLPARWSITNRIFSLSLRSLAPGPPRPPASRLWNPVNSSPRTLPVQHPPPSSPSHDDHPNLPVQAPASPVRDEFPLLSLTQHRLSRPSPNPSSLALQPSPAEGSINGRTSIGFPREPKSLRTNSQPPTPGPSNMPSHPDNDPENGLKPRDPNLSRISIPGSTRMSIGSASAASAPGDDDAASEFPWGPAHPCFPHLNPHVPLDSDLYDSTRIIRIKRDWMMQGDLAPTFANLYPEILDPLVTEDDFRIVIKKINDTLVAAFDPFTFRAWLDAVMGVATCWLWDDVGLTGVKRQLADLERWIEEWNRKVGRKEAVTIIPLRRTGYLTLDIQIPDPHLAPDTGSLPQLRADGSPIDMLQQRDQKLPYTVTPTLQVNSQPSTIEARS